MKRILDSTLDSKHPSDGPCPPAPALDNTTENACTPTNAAPTKGPGFVNIESRETSTADANTSTAHELTAKTWVGRAGLDSILDSFFGKGGVA